MILLYTVIFIACLWGISLNRDTRKQDICIASAVFFFISALLWVNPPDFMPSNAMFFYGCATFALTSILWALRAHYLLLSVCFLGLCTHTFGYLIAIESILVSLSVYNNLVLTLDLLFIGLLLALSDAGIPRITMARIQARDAFLSLLDRGKVGN